MNNLDKLKNSLVPSLVSGAVGAGIFYAMYGDGGVSVVPLGPLEVPVWAAIGTTTAIGNLGGEILSEFILPHFQKSQFLMGMEEHIIPPVVAGATTYLGMRILINDDIDIMQSVMIGAGSSVAGKYIYGAIGL